MTVRRCSAVAVALMAPLAVASSASAHSVMKVDAGVIHYTANDDVSLNDVVVTVQGSNLRFVDRGADGGISPASECSPGAADERGWIYEVTCPRSGITGLRFDVGEAQDKITAQLPLNVIAAGGTGADTIVTGDGVDTINGGAGNDTIRSAGGNDHIVGDVGDDSLYGEAGDDVVQGALGSDTADGGPGNDDVRVRDGAADRAICGDGNDRVQADELDTIEAACETVDRQGTAAPPPDQPPGSPGGDPTAPPPAPDTTAPRIRAGGSTLQRAGRAGRLVVIATSSEASELVAGGYVTIGENRLVLRSARGAVKVGGGGIRLTLTLAARDARKLRRHLSRRRKASARVSVVATDLAGNSSVAKLPRITLRR